MEHAGITGIRTGSGATAVDPLFASDRRDAALALRDWLLADDTRGAPWAELLCGFAGRLHGLDVPVQRITTAIDALHSEYTGIGRIWTAEGGYTFRTFPHGPDTDAVFRRSPFQQAHDSGEWLLLDLTRIVPDAFGIVPELVESGYAHYLVVPLRFTNGSKNGLTFATRDPAGFGPDALATLRFVVPTFAAIMEARSITQRLDNVLRIYVGDEPHKQILAGTIRRGEVSRIRSSILFADMRSYTRITSVLPPEDAVALLNTFFDCLVPPVEAGGGEVLKYMGDGLLAIFRDDETGERDGAAAALAAASDGLARLRDANGAGLFPVPVEAGIALHHGDAAYGNVGSGSRLDFTVIGRDVNLASRIAGCNKHLGEPLLMSQAFAARLGAPAEALDSQILDGFADPVPIFRPLAAAAPIRLAG